MSSLSPRSLSSTLQVGLIGAQQSPVGDPADELLFIATKHRQSVLLARGENFDRVLE
jgi:hypothetical protein